MAEKKTGISRELLIHPGETIADVLTEREMTQADLAILTGVSPAYINQVIKGKKGISARFALALEYAFGVPMSFWINLQANYDAERLELEKENTVTDKELEIVSQLKEVVAYLGKQGKIKVSVAKKMIVLSLREILKVRDLENLRSLAVNGSFRMSSRSNVNPYVMGAWLRLCQLQGDRESVKTKFDAGKVESLIAGIKRIMCDKSGTVYSGLKTLMAQHGIDFSIVANFKGAPVQGYISQKSDASYQMVLTIRGAYADIFWFSLFHELGHIYNGDVEANVKFIDYDKESDVEKLADAFASDKLIDANAYQAFVWENDFSLPKIQKFAQQHNIMPYIVIGRLQKEKKIPYSWYSKEKLRYKWGS